MKKRIVSLLLAVMMLLTALPAAFAEEGQTIEELLGIDMTQYPKTMYVYTENGGKLNVRREPSTESDKIGKVWIYAEYPYFEKAEAEDYNWYRIADGMWIADDGTWLEFS